MPAEMWIETISRPSARSGSYTAMKSPTDGCDVVMGASSTLSCLTPGNCIVQCNGSCALGCLGDAGCDAHCADASVPTLCGSTGYWLCEERCSLDGDEYEAFNTSGGLGTLCTTLEGQVEELNYKTIRYPGHRDLVSFVMHDLGFDHDMDSLKAAFLRTVPTTVQDKCIILVEAMGYTDDGGPATSAELNEPDGLAVDSQGNLFIADAANAVIREVNATTHIITTVASNEQLAESGDSGPAASALASRRRCCG